MTEAAPNGTAQGKPGGGRRNYDILILDASHKHSLTSARNLARAGLQVALGESGSQYAPRHEPPSFRSRCCAHPLVLPDYVSEPAADADAVLAFVREHGTRVVLPVGDANITLLVPQRERSQN